MVDVPVPQAGLRRPGVRVFNKSNGPAKAAIIVAAGGELEVDADVAAQLVGQTQAFTITDNDVAGTGVVVETVGDVPAAVPGVSVEEAGGSSARLRSGRRKAGE